MRLNLLYKLDDLLEVCKGCEKNSGSEGPETRCKGCQTYGELRKIGENLGRKKAMVKPLPITAEEYVQLHHVEGKKRNEICELKGMKPSALSNWKWNHKDEIEEALANAPQPDTAEKEVSESKPTQDDKTTEYEGEITSLSYRIDSFKKQIAEQNYYILDLQAKVAELENLHAACEDVENELASLREENARLAKQGHHNSYIISNQKYQLEKWATEMGVLEEENKALKYFARKYLA
jgi:chromosome segregation ATPase